MIAAKRAGKEAMMPALGRDTPAYPITRFAGSNPTTPSRLPQMAKVELSRIYNFPWISMANSDIVFWQRRSGRR
jgi:hypothetical protein